MDRAHGITMLGWSDGAFEHEFTLTTGTITSRFDAEFS